ncbi:MAG: hypothetical protein JO223_21040 [Hyphomicrobiales bacterium]|nr:hypothetical protein [Hyphomicrobiales bacterium]
MNSFIDRAVALEHFKLARKHVAEGQQCVDAQIVLMARLERDGHDTTGARALLDQFEEALALQIQALDCISQELEEGV